MTTKRRDFSSISVQFSPHCNLHSTRSDFCPMFDTVVIFLDHNSFSAKATGMKFLHFFIDNRLRQIAFFPVFLRVLMKDSEMKRPYLLHFSFII